MRLIQLCFPRRIQTRRIAPNINTLAPPAAALHRGPFLALVAPWPTAPGHAGEGAGVSQRPGQVMQVVKALPCALLGPPLHPTLQTSWREGGRGRPLLGPGALFAG